MAYRLLELPMILSNLRGHSPIANFFKCDFSYSNWQSFNSQLVARSLCDSWDCCCCCYTYYKDIDVLTIEYVGYD